MAATLETKTKFTINNGEDFFHYVNHKYKGRTAINPVDKREVIIDNICDMNFEDLDLEDQRIALRPQICWAWGVGNNKADFWKASEYRGYLYRPMQRNVIISPCPYVGYYGGFGSSKSTLMWLYCLMVAFAFPGAHILIMRTTLKQLKNTTLNTFYKMARHFGWRDGVHYRHHISDKKIMFPIGNEVSEIYYMSTKNDSGDINQVIDDLQSFELDVIAVDESAGMDESIFLAAQGRIGRWGVVKDQRYVKLLCVGNPPSTDHYQYKMLENKTNSKDDPLNNPGDYHCVWAASYENRAGLAESYLERLESYPENWKNTFLYGKPGYIQNEGSPVFETSFDYDRHVSQTHIPYIKDKIMIRGWDLGPTAKYKACVIMQLDNYGTLNILSEILDDSPGIERFGKKVLAECRSKYPEADRWLDYCDPAGFDKTETDIKSPAIILQNMGIGLLRGEKGFAIRKDSVDHFLSKNVQYSRPGFQIDGNNCPLIVRGFQGGYAYKVQDHQTGQFSMNPIKNIYSHLMDAIQYPCSKISNAPTDKQRQDMLQKIKDSRPAIYKSTTGNFKNKRNYRSPSNRYTRH